MATVYGALPTGRRVRVLLISEDDPFLENALKADPSLAVKCSSRSSGART
jgi:hypothetical protein